MYQLFLVLDKEYICFDLEYFSDPGTKNAGGVSKMGGGIGVCAANKAK